jgi:hypothetical protein
MWRPGKKELFYLIILFSVAYVVRGIPSWFNWGWGNDFGIYYGLTQQLVDDPALFKPYTGWGQTYHYFPMLYIIIAGLHNITGIEIEMLFRIVAPLMGAATVVLFYFVVKSLKVNSTVSFISALILAMNPFHAYQTSHAAPMTVGHFFLALSLLFFLRMSERYWYFPILCLSSLFLIMSHHLTTFIYLLIIVGIFFFRGFDSDKRPDKFLLHLVYLVFLTSLIFAYWFFLAPPVFNSFMKGGLSISPYLTVALFYLGIFIMVVLLELKYRFNFNYKPKRFTKQQELIITGSVFILLLVIIGLFSLTDLTTGFKLLSSALLLLIPTILIYSIAFIGLNRIDFEPYGSEVKGMLYPVLFIFGFSLITWNHILLPFRFLEYIAYSISILSAIGFIAFSEIEFDISWKSLATKVKVISVLFIAAIIISGGTTYAVQRATSQYEESISEQVAISLEYLDSIAPVNQTVASDHRISVLLWQHGFNSTYDYAYNLWFSRNWDSQACLAELNGHGTELEYGQIGYIVIDSVMVRDGVQSNINETPRAINATGYEKFNHQPFELIFESVSDEKYIENDVSPNPAKNGIYPYTRALSVPIPDAVDWCRVYMVNWTYIKDFS